MNCPLRHLAPCLLAFSLLTVPGVHAQKDDLGNALKSIGQKYADNYTQPLTDALGADANAGLFRTADFGDTGLLPLIDLYVGMSAMGALTSGSAEFFRLENDQIQTDDGRTLIVQYPNQDLPTALGDNASPGTADLIDQQTGTQVGEVTLPGSLVNTPIAPLAVPHVGIGTVLGTDAQLRYLPEIEMSNYGSVSLFGLAVRHNVSQYIPHLPLAVALQGSWQQLRLSGTDQNDVFDASGWAVNAHVSRGIPLLPATVYGGVQYEHFDVDLDYVLETEAGRSAVTLDQTAANNVRALAGVAISLAVVRINLDYALSSNNTVSAGVGFVL